MGDIIKITKHKKPNFKIIGMDCDRQLDDELNQYGLMQYLNSGGSANAILGKPMSGKTTTLNSIFDTKPIDGGLKFCYHDIYLFQPESSRRSMKKDIWTKGVKKDHIYESLDDLENVYELIKAEDKETNSCIIFDDMAAYMADHEKTILSILQNRRHYHISIFILTQNWNSLPLKCRKLMENIFIFRVSPNELDQVIEETLGRIKNKYVQKIIEFVNDKPHNFWFLSVYHHKMFKNFDEEMTLQMD